MTMRKLSPSAALALAVLRGQAQYEPPVQVRGRSRFCTPIRRLPPTERAVALRGKDGQRQ